MSVEPTSPAEESVLSITEALAIPRSELTYRATRSGGAGGQHVNTSSTRVELTWSAAESPSLSEEQRARILEKLHTRLDGEGVLRLVEGGSRSQHQNKEGVTERFQELLRHALHVQKPRKKTRPPRASREQRLRAKKHRAETKRMRGKVDPAE